MAFEVVDTRWDERIFIDVKGLRNALGEHIDDIVIRIPSVVELGPEGRLPLLRLQDTTRVGGVINETLKVQLPNAANLGTGCEIEVDVALVCVHAIDEANFGVVVGADLVPDGAELEPVVFVSDIGPHVGVSADRGCRRAEGRIPVNHQVLKKYQPGVHASAPVVAVQNIARFFVDAHYAEVRVSKESALHADHSVVGVRIRAVGTSLNVHNADFILAQRACHLRSAVNRNDLAGVGIDADLSAEKEKVLEAGREVEDASVLQEEWALFRKEELERGQIELLLVYIGVRKIGVSCQVGHQVRAQAVLDVHPSGIQRV